MRRKNRFYRAAWNASVTSYEKGVCLSVRVSNACIVTKRKKDLFRFYTPYERSVSLAFREEWLVGGDPFYLKFWQRWSEIADFQSIFARSASAVAPSKKVQLTLIGWPLRAFQWAYEHRMLLLSHSKGGGFKNAKRPFSL